jgi:hypothetical protein
LPANLGEIEDAQVWKTAKVGQPQSKMGSGRVGRPPVNGVGKIPTKFILYNAADKEADMRYGKLCLELVLILVSEHCVAQDSPLSVELLEDGKTLAAVVKECKGHSGSLIGHAVGDLQKQLGKEMTPKVPEDVKAALRIMDDCTSYLSSPTLVSGMELPAAQQARRDADNTLQKLDEISRKLSGVGLQSFEARTRQHLQTLATQPVFAGRQPLSPNNLNGGTVEPLAVYQRVSNAPDLPGRITPEAVQAIIVEASEAQKHDTDSFLAEATSTVSADLLAIQSATMRYPNFANHPLMQSIAGLKRQLGKSLQPKNVSDVETVTDLLSRTLPIFGGSEFGPAHGHVDAERKAVREYAARQSAISGTVSTIIEIERTLDRGNLIAANGQYAQIGADRFMSGFPPAQHYLAQTQVLRNEVAAYGEATQVPRVQQTQSSLTQVLVFGSEVAKLETFNGKSLATETLSRNVTEDRQAVQSRLASLPAFSFDPGMYKLQPITSEGVAQQLTARLRELSGNLNSSRDLADLLASQDGMEKIRALFGEAVDTDLRRKGKSLAPANQMAAALSNAVEAHQRQAAEAQARRQAELEEQQALAGKIVNGALIVVMLEEKFQQTSIMGYQMEANKQRTQLHNLMEQDRKLLTPQVWKAVQSEFERLMPGLTVYQASSTQALLSSLRR